MTHPYADAPLNFWSWLELNRPDLVKAYEAVGETSKVPQIDDLINAWDGAIEASMRLMHECPLRHLSESVEHLRVGPPINVSTAKNGVGYGAWTRITGFSEAVVQYIAAIESTH